MEGFKEIYSTNNHIRLNQIEQALQNAGIEVYIKGRQALEIGNIELTGIRGAQVMVNELNMGDAKKVLQLLGIDTAEDQHSSGIGKMVWVLGIILLAVLLVMIYAAYFR